MKVTVFDLCGDEKWEDTLEGARDFLIGMWENMDVDEDDMEEDEITVEEHIENIKVADFQQLDEYLQGVGYYMERDEYVYICDSCLEVHEDETDTCESCGGPCSSVHEDDIQLHQGI
jgi:hypothetical protein